MFDLFWDFNRLFEGEAQVEADIEGSRPLFRASLGLGFM
jgi:hypothetical protein